MAMRMIKRRTPSGRTAILYRRKKGDKPKCAVCKKPLHGVVVDHPRHMKWYPKSQKKVSRPYGGYMCHKCLERMIISKVREEALKLIQQIRNGNRGW